MTEKNRVEALAEAFNDAIETACKAAVIAERVRIWNEIHASASTRGVWDGDKESVLISLGEPKLRDIVLPALDEESEADAEVTESPALPNVENAPTSEAA